MQPDGSMKCPVIDKYESEKHQAGASLKYGDEGGLRSVGRWVFDILGAASPGQPLHCGAAQVRLWAFTCLGRDESVVRGTTDIVVDCPPRRIVDGQLDKHRATVHNGWTWHPQRFQLTQQTQQPGPSFAWNHLPHHNARRRVTEREEPVGCQCGKQGAQRLCVPQRPEVGPAARLSLHWHVPGSTCQSPYPTSSPLILKYSSKLSAAPG
jgi:hypothetical protein